MPPKLLVASSKADDMLEALLDPRVAEAIAKALQPALSLSLEEVVGKRMEGMLTAIRELKQENSKLATMCESAAKEIIALKLTVDDQSRRLDDMEVYSRATNIIITGLPESSFAELATPAPTLSDNSAMHESQGSVAASVVRFCKKALNIVIQPTDIAVAHRLKASGRDAVRPVIVRFVNRQVRDSVYMAKKVLKANQDRIYISEHLTKKNAELFFEARKLLREKRIYAAWTQKGLVHIRQSADPSCRPSVITCRRDLNIRDG